MFFYVKAKELYTQKNYLEAINHFYNALKINDQFCKTYYYLALCYYETGDKTKALIYLEKSLELYPDLNKSKDLYEKIKDFESL
jgi:tetratricopeptide (TPR) repeat protein